MSDKLERFRKRQKLKQRLDKKDELYDVNSLAQIDRGVNHDLLIQLDREQTEEFNPVYDLSVSEHEVRSCLFLLDTQFSTQKYEALFNSTKEVVIDQLLRPLNLSRRDLASNDVDGGPVTTLNNFKDGVVANEKDQQSYNELKNSQEQFNRSKYENSEFKKMRKEHLKQDELRDGYTGKEIPKDGRSHLDHITSAHEIDSDPMNHIAMNEKERVTMANSANNLTMTDSSLNQSKSDKDLKKWNNSQNAKDKTNDNGEHYSTDDKLVNSKYSQSKQHIKSTQNKKYYNKLASETLTTSITEAKSVGLQQAIGSLFSELISAIFIEVKDSFINGFKSAPDETFWQALKARLFRVIGKVVGNWDSVINALQSGLMGAISGFASNICTVVINLLVKTSKNMVRLIRESFMSLMKALKILLSPPEGMSFKESAHEASKLIGTGLVVSLGIFAEEAISTYLQGFAIPFSGVISAVITGLMTGLSSLLVVFMLDKLDLFGVNAEERHKFIMGELDSKINNSILSSESIIRKLGIVD